jgi:hypothetical protein
MKYNFYDIVAESEDGLTEFAVDRNYTLEIPDHDLSTPMERQEHFGVMLDKLIEASGVSVLSFRTKEVV